MSHVLRSTSCTQYRPHEVPGTGGTARRPRTSLHQIAKCRGERGAGVRVGVGNGTRKLRPCTISRNGLYVGRAEVYSYALIAHFGYRHSRSTPSWLRHWKYPDATLGATSRDRTVACCTNGNPYARVSGTIMAACAWHSAKCCIMCPTTSGGGKQ